jgi:high-affinity iron transporter
METALLLIQIHEPRILTGVFLGIVGAAAMAFAWARFGYLINLKRFFQVTSIFLLLFVVQILIYSFHEFTEAGILPNSEWFHEMSEPFSPDGLYGKWFTFLMIGTCAAWLIGAWFTDRFARGDCRREKLASAVAEKI